MIARHVAVLAVLAGLASGCGGDDVRGAATAPQTTSARPTPYQASLAFAVCMRRHGVPHPNPDPSGDFHLTPKQEQLMRKAGPHKHELAERACFHYLKGTVSTKPLSRHARALAVKALLSFSRCMRGRGYDFFADPVVRNLSRGRASFGFKKSDPRIMKAQRTKRFLQAQASCEKGLSAKLDKIIKEDRGELPY